MRDHPDYSITEMVLASFYFAGAVAFFLSAAHALGLAEPYNAIEGVGGGLMLLGGCADPKRYLIECLTYPFSFVDRAGRDTPITLLAGYLGFALWLLGVALNWASA